MSGPAARGIEPSPGRRVRPAVEGRLFAAAGPNLLLITIDTLRADHLGSYGFADIDTPHLDRLARQGVRFDQVATSAGETFSGRFDDVTLVQVSINFKKNYESTEVLNGGCFHVKVGKNSFTSSRSGPPFGLSA